MAQQNKVKKTRNFRLTLVDDKTHKHLWSAHFTKVGFIVAIISALVMLSAAVFCVVAYTPVRTFIPGYPDAHSKRAAIQNAIRIDSLENVIYRWELYSENLRRAVEGEEPVNIDSLINIHNREKELSKDPEYVKRQDSLLREEVRTEEMFDISGKDQRKLPIEGMMFFTPLKGVISQGYDAALHPFVDITAPEGSVVSAIADGTVIYEGWSDADGYTLHIQHDGDIVSIYKHNEKLLKRTGDKVKAGSPIALIGNTGSLTTGEHLHFELWYKGETLDPTRYINF